ncbi:MAG TPA: TetR/AcrR family transcriptional regulator [Stellaceae bacterium]|nr:TetR/AcrR family transcriptional regulator [Stellaceae bacterium]
MSATDASIAVPTGPTGKAESILAAARRTFLASGFGAVSMDTIAREAGASKATLYAYFSSKEELFGAVVAHEGERYFSGFSARELDPRKVEASLTEIARRFLELVLSPDAIAVNRITIAEAVRFPQLGEVFWRAGPERTRSQIEAFLRRAMDAGTLGITDARLAAEQFIALLRGDIHLRQLLRLDTVVGAAELDAAANGAVATFLKAFGVVGAD